MRVVVMLIADEDAARLRVLRERNPEMENDAQALLFALRAAVSLPENATAEKGVIDAVNFRQEGMPGGVREMAIPDLFKDIIDLNKCRKSGMWPVATTIWTADNELRAHMDKFICTDQVLCFVREGSGILPSS